MNKQLIASFDETKKRCKNCQTYYSDNDSRSIPGYCRDICYQNVIIKENIKNISKKYQLNEGELQWLWRSGKRTDESELADAVIDALAQGGIHAWNGDGVGCVVQLIYAFAKMKNEKPN